MAERSKGLQLEKEQEHDLKKVGLALRSSWAMPKRQQRENLRVTPRERERTCVLKPEIPTASGMYCVKDLVRFLCRHLCNGNIPFPTVVWHV
jgi:hypothetical protein